MMKDAPTARTKIRQARGAAHNRYLLSLLLAWAGVLAAAAEPASDLPQLAAVTTLAELRAVTPIACMHGENRARVWLGYQIVEDWVCVYGLVDGPIALRRFNVNYGVDRPTVEGEHSSTGLGPFLLSQIGDGPDSVELATREGMTRDGHLALYMALVPVGSGAWSVENVVVDEPPREDEAGDAPVASFITGPAVDPDDIERPAWLAAQQTATLELAEPVDAAPLQCQLDAFIAVHPAVDPLAPVAFVLPDAEGPLPAPGGAQCPPLDLAATWVDEKLVLDVRSPAGFSRYMEPAACLLLRLWIDGVPHMVPREMAAMATQPYEVDDGQSVPTRLLVTTDLKQSSLSPGEVAVQVMWSSPGWSIGAAAEHYHDEVEVLEPTPGEPAWRMSPVTRVSETLP